MPGCRCGTCRKRLPTLIREPPCAMTEPARPWTGTPPTSSPLTLLAQRDRPRSPQAFRLAELEPARRTLKLTGTDEATKREQDKAHEPPICICSGSVSVVVRRPP